MSQRLAAAYLRTARRLMADGVLGQDLWNRIVETYPAMTVEQQQSLRKRIAAEHGILGQVLHDPNLYSNCHQAKVAKKASPNASLMILTSQTPYCDSCGYRQANQCGLMGGELISGEIPEGAVHRVASHLEDNGLLAPEVSRRVRTSELPTNRRVAAMVQATQQVHVDQISKVRAQLDSNRAASVLMPGESDMNLQPKKLTGSRKASNADALDEFSMSSADQTVAREASSWSGMMDSEALTIDTTDVVEPGRRVSITAAPMIDYDPELYRSTGRRHASVVEEHAEQAHQQLNQLMRTAGRIFSRGEMTVKLASQILSHSEVLQENGATLDKGAKKLAHQLSVLAGKTADIEGDLEG